jgi:hypothetical protein
MERIEDLIAELIASCAAIECAYDRQAEVVAALREAWPKAVEAERDTVEA